MSASADAPSKAPKQPVLDNPLEKIEKLLTCSICLDRYKHPKLLPCQHTFCLMCLSNYADNAVRRLKCPECRAEHPFDAYEGVAAFPTNLTLAGFLDIHLQATNATAAEFKAYIETYNLERCKVCDEKAQLQVCVHCERKTCDECRKTHVEMLKRDLARLLNQVKRLSNRLREASSGLDKSLTALLLNGESTKSEIRDYFHRYREELRQRETYFLSEADAFLESERRVMSTLRDTLAVEAANVEDACAWTDAALAGARAATDLELSQMKNLFVDGINYLRNFQPDSDDLFGKKLRFSPGDDASKLPSAISNFGEITVCLPQCGNRYVPLESHFLPKPLRIPLESSLGNLDECSSLHAASPFRYGLKSAATDDRYLRRFQLEEDAWNRLRVSNTSSNHSRCASPLTSTSPSRHPFFLSNSNITQKDDDQRTQETETTQIESGERLHIDTSVTTPTRSAASSPSKIPKSTSPLARTISPQNSVQTAASSTKNSPNPSSQTARGRDIRKQNSLDKSKQRKKSTTAEPPTTQKNRPFQSDSKANNSTKTLTNQSTVGASKAEKTPQSQLTAVPKNGWAEELSQKFNNNHNSQPLCLAQAATTQDHRPISVTILPQKSSLQQKSSEDINGNTKADLIKTDSTVTNKSQRGKPPVPRQRSSQDDTSLNEKVAHIRRNHESINERIDRIRKDHEVWIQEQTDKSQMGSYTRIRSISVISLSIDGDAEITKRADQSRPKNHHKSRILYRSSSSRPVNRPFRVELEEQKLNISHESMPSKTDENGVQFIPITHYPTNSCGEWPSDKERRFSRSNTNPDPKKSKVLANLSTQPHSDPSDKVISTKKTSTEIKSHMNGFIDVMRADVNSNNLPQLTTLNGTRNFINESDLLSVDYACKERPIIVVGRRGAERGCMNWPRGVTALPGNEFAVCDSANHRVQIFDANGCYITAFGTYGSGPGQFNNCTGIAYHCYRKQLVVADSYNHRIQIFDLDGQFVRQFGTRGSSSGQFNNPWGIAVDEIGLIYVADKGETFVIKQTRQAMIRKKNPIICDNHRVQVFDRTGRFIHAFGGFGDALGQFNHPLYIAIQANIQHIFITDSANHRVCVHAHDGTPIRILGSEGFKLGELKLPRGIAVDIQGFVIVADSGNNRVQVFTPKDCSTAAFGAWGNAPGELKGIEDVALSSGGERIICADRENHRIQIF